MTLTALALAFLVQAQEPPAEPEPTAESSPEPTAEQGGASGEYAYKEPVEIKSTLSKVLADPEFRRLAPKEAEKEKETKAPGWLQRFLDWLFGSDRDERKASPAPQFGFAQALVGLLTWVLYGIVALAFAFVVFWIVKGILGRSDRSRLGETKSGAGKADAVMPSTPPGEQPSEEYLREALRLGQAGKYREAIRQLLLGTMSWIERNELIRFRKGLTNRDYLRAVWNQPKRRDPMEALILVFDQVYFGRRSATAERFQECLGHYRSGFSSPS